MKPTVNTAYHKKVHLAFYSRHWRLLLGGPMLFLACNLGRIPPRPLRVADGSHDRPQEIAQDFWNWRLNVAPLWASEVGDANSATLLPDLGHGARTEAHRSLQHLQARLSQINIGYLDSEALTTARILGLVLQDQLDLEVCQLPLWQLELGRGPHLALLALSYTQPVDTEAAARGYIRRLWGLGVLLEQHQDNLSLGIEQRTRPARALVTQLIAQLEATLADPDRATPYLRLLERAERLSEPVRQALHKDIAAALSQHVMPALGAYAAFLRTQVLPFARPEAGVWANADGQRCYDVLRRRAVGRSTSAEDLHVLGRDELTRLQRQLALLARAAGQPSAAAYLKQLQRAPRAAAEGPAGVLAETSTILARATSALPRLIDSPPSMPLQVRALSPARARALPLGLYQPGSVQPPRPAVFFANTQMFAQQPQFNLESITFHETVPGHHLQMALAQESQNLPLWRQHIQMPAFAEGWALYAERLSDGLGLYSSEAARAGMLNLQAWRAARLVVDTGVHALGWTREAALAYFTDNVVADLESLNAEVDSILAAPGQALAHMSGCLEFERLRAQAQVGQGSAFDLRRFHGHLLRQGPLPWALIDDNLAQWMATQATP